MKIKLLFSLSILCILVLFIGSMILQANLSPYTITKPFIFPEATQTYQYPEQRDRMTPEERLGAHILPDGVASQMTTAALLDTFLINNRIVDFSGQQFYHTRFEGLVESYRYGLNELMDRADLWNCVIQKYRSIKTYTNPFYRFLNEKTQEHIQDKIYDDYTDRIMLLELLAALINQPEHEDLRIKFEYEIEQRTLKELKHPNIYGGECYYSMYYGVIHGKQVEDKLYGWKKQ